jgi:hypothetical protein
MSAAQRRAALTMHALQPRDQRWVLQRLPAQQRAVVAGLLGELRELGIPSDRGLLQSVLETSAAAPAPAVPAEPGPAALAGGPLSTGLLRDEPAFVWAACLLDRAPDEQRRLLAALAPSQAAAVRALMAGRLAHAPQLRHAVRQALARHAGAQATDPSAPPSGLWAGLWAAVWRMARRAAWAGRRRVAGPTMLPRRGMAAWVQHKLRLMSGAAGERA